jgi:hypothetical protein
MRKMSNWHHSQAVGKGKDVDTAPHNDVQYHSLPVGHKKSCDETPFQKMSNVTDKLLVIGKDAIRSPFIKKAMSPTNYQS